MRHHRPGRHVRIIRTKRGRKRIIVNPNVPKAKGKNCKGLIGGFEIFSDRTSKGAVEAAKQIDTVGESVADSARHMKRGRFGKGLKTLGKGGIKTVKGVGKGGIIVVKGGVEAVKELPKKDRKRYRGKKDVTKGK